jgi:hypothetical protein
MTPGKIKRIIKRLRNKPAVVETTSGSRYQVDYGLFVSVSRGIRGLRVSIDLPNGLILKFRPNEIEAIHAA